MKKLPKYLKVEEVSRLLNAPSRLNLRDRLILRILYKCGLRVSELCNLHLEDIDYQEGVIYIRNGKGGKDRVVPVDHYTLDLIDHYCNGAMNGILITSNRGKEISTRQIERIVDKYAKQAQIKSRVHPHMLRHSFAVHCLKAGMNLRSVQKMLGHSSLTTTQIYLDLTADDVKKDYTSHPLPL